MEIAGCCHRYHAARMHTIWIGSEPPDWYLEAEALLKRALEAGKQAARHGAVAKDVDAAMRSIVSQLSQPHWMSARSAYSIGLGCSADWSEKCVLIDSTSTAELQAGMTLHIIPWLQLPGRGGMGFSTTALVRRDAPALDLFEADAPKYYERTVRVHAVPASPPRQAATPEVVATAAMAATAADTDARLAAGEALCSSGLPVELDDLMPPVDGWMEPTPSTADAITPAMAAAMAAAHAFHAGLSRTPLKTVRLGGTEEGGKGPTVYLKDETCRLGLRGCSVLGVKFAVDRLVSAGRLQYGGTVGCTSVDGGHCEAVAVVAKKRGLRAVVYAPASVCAERVAVLRGLGAEVKEMGGSVEDCTRQLRAEAAVAGWAVVAEAGSGDDGDEVAEVEADMLMGATQVFKEVCEQLSEPPTHVFVQGGSGPLLGAAAAYVSSHFPEVKLVSVEAADAACVHENLKAGRVATSELSGCEGGAASAMAGLNCKLPPAAAWPLVRAHVRCSVAIGDEWAREAVKSLYHDHGHRVSETGGAAYAGVIAALSLSGPGGDAVGLDSESRVLVVLSEGVASPSSFNALMGTRVHKLSPKEVADLIATRCGLKAAVPAEAAATVIKVGAPAKGAPAYREIKRGGLSSLGSQLFGGTPGLSSSMDSLGTVMCSSSDDLHSVASSASTSRLDRLTDLAHEMDLSDESASELSGHGREAWTAAGAVAKSGDGKPGGRQSWTIPVDLK